MKRLSIFFSLIAILSFNAFAQSQSNEAMEVLQPTEAQMKQTVVVTNLLNNYHYRKTPLSDSLSQVVFDQYLSSLDNGKLYFQQSDIDAFQRYKLRLDDDLKRGNLEAAYVIFEIFRQRMIDRMVYLNEVLDEGFDFSTEEYFDTKAENEKYASSLAEWNERWRKYMKLQALNLMLADRDYESAKEVLKKRYNTISRTLRQYRSEDVFQVYMNALTEAFDPHTSYFSPITAEKFQEEMSLTFEGIGARLQMEDEYTKIVEVIAGGPAFKSKELQANDLIVGVGQGVDGEIEDVVGWRLDDVVALIKGPKGTKVRLKIKPGEGGINAPPMEVVLERDQIKLEDEAAKAELLQVERNGRNYNVGVITIPNFYMDFAAASKGDPNYRSTTRDVKRLITELQEQKVEGIIIDLRRNGGGALLEAIQLTGLFVNQGPVVQIRSGNGAVRVEEDDTPNVFYDGPLSVLVDRFSASASEIFAGAIQDYKRGVVIGETTFGKGTVQNVIDLETYLPQERDKLGQLKFTLGMYYRVNGESTQQRGVVPDVNLPSIMSAEEFGESSRSNALPFEKINQAKFKPNNKIDTDLVKNLNNYFANRLKNEQDLNNLLAEIEDIKKERAETRISLNLEVRKDQIKLAEQIRTARNKLSGNVGSSEIKNVKDKAPLTNDIYLKESVMIMSEMLFRKVG